MFKNRRIPLLGIALFIVAASLATISALKAPTSASVNLSWPPRPNYSFLAAKGNNAGVDQYDRKESGTGVQNELVKYYQEGLVKSYQIERNLMSPSDSQFNYRQGHWFGQ